MNRLATVLLVALVAVTCKTDGGSGTPVPTTVTVSPGNANLTAVNATQSFSANVFDQNGNVMSAAVTWSSSNTGVATVSGSGVATAVANGAATIRARAGTPPDTALGTAGVTVAQVATAVVKVQGDAQSGPPSTALPTPLIARANDANGFPVANVTVGWAATLGGGSLSAPSQITASNGQTAGVTWTLGATLGAQQATASATGAASAIFGATAAVASPVVLTSVQPDTLVEGQSAVLKGSGFSATPNANMVTIGGTSATVTAAADTELTVTVPSFDCQPARDVGVSVTFGGNSSGTLNKRLHPPSFTSLAVGEQLIVQTPAQFCLQFRPSATGGDQYLVGVGAAAETPTSLMSVTVAGAAGGAAAAGAAVAARASSPLVPARGTMSAAPWSAEVLQRRADQQRADLALRQWERTHLATRPQVTLAPLAPQTPIGVPAVGDTIRLNVFTDVNNLCTVFTSVLAQVQVVGAAGIWVTDTANPAQDSLTLAEIQAYSDTFDTKIYGVDTLNFGAPSDLDSNQRVYILFTIQVNKLPINAAGFVFSGDLYPTAVCASSNTGEIFYSQVPDPGNVSGTGARSRSSVLFQMPSLIAHEFAHNIQYSRRLVLAAGQLLSTWEAEGQASLAEEVVGHSVLGNATGQDYGSAIAFGANAGDRWYAGAFQQMAMYYGWVPPGTSTKAVGAPEQCTLFGTLTLVTVCNTFHFYGASWSFMRYVTDRFGGSYPGGATALQRDWIGKNVGMRGVPNVEALLGVDFDSLFSQWAATLYVDGRVGGVPSAMQMGSWDLFNVFNAFVTDAFRLIPTDRNFVTFSDARSVRGGSSAYTRLLSGGARPALALRVRDGSGNVLGTTMRPQLWIVRLQ